MVVVVGAFCGAAEQVGVRVKGYAVQRSRQYLLQPQAGHHRCGHQITMGTYRVLMGISDIVGLTGRFRQPTPGSAQVRGRTGRRKSHPAGKTHKCTYYRPD